VKGRALVKALTGARLARAEAARVANIVANSNSQDRCEYLSIEVAKEVVEGRAIGEKVQKRGSNRDRVRCELREVSHRSGPVIHPRSGLARIKMVPIAEN
jgi:hypothetical protein